MKIVVLTGAGMSAESGIKTFRDSDGLWENHRIEDVATPEAWHRNPELVTLFYNQRREQLSVVKPNEGHLALKSLEVKHEVIIITQNVDDLHERAGSTQIIHLHGELTKLRSVKFETDLYDVGYKSVKHGEKCPKGTILRPFIVWFGESVPMIEKAVEITQKADMLIVVGTSLEVYPAAGLIHEVKPNTPIVLIDPNRHDNIHQKNIHLIKDTAANALPKLVNKLLNEH
ncbi:MAG: NAD-dependent deacylase [Bacteroidota bacterium]|nr:NAD-dependent deacylase [Bacteroidota bacterium]